MKIDSCVSIVLIFASLFVNISRLLVQHTVVCVEIDTQCLEIKGKLVLLKQNWHDLRREMRIALPLNEDDEEEYEPPPRKVRISKPAPPPKEFKRKSIRTEPTDSELYSKANMEILRNKLYQQTRQRLIGDLFNY